MGMDHFKTQRGMYRHQRKGLIIVAIGIQNLNKSTSRTRAKTVSFVTGRVELMVLESRGYFWNQNDQCVLSRRQENLQFVIGGDSSWNDANDRIWETRRTLSI